VLTKVCGKNIIGKYLYEFSQRIGLEPKELPIQRESMNDDLRNCLWNVLYHLYTSYVYYSYGTAYWNDEGKRAFNSYWHLFFKWPLDKMLNSPEIAIKTVREKFFKFAWNEVYDFLEFTSDYLYDKRSKEFRDSCNIVLERENSAYRFIDKYITEIVSKKEIESIENALNVSKPYKAVSTHMESALNYLCNREKPDYRNSIKESISAVESIAKIISKQPNATLGEVLNIKDFQLLHPAFKKGLKEIYGYTSDADGIRHALINDTQTSTADEARFMLVLCSAFINYLIAKAK
jgi:hypothetical protein